MSHFVYDFTFGDQTQKKLLGGKGANLAEMTKLGIPVPHGFTVTTEACREFLDNNNKISDTMWAEIEDHIKELEKKSGKTFGGDNPLLVSVRSGAPVSMPGMMDTILNLGLNDHTVEVLAAKTENPRFAYDSYRRFIQMFSDVVLGVDHHLLEAVITELKKSKNYQEDTEVTAEEWKQIIEKFKTLVQDTAGAIFPQDPKDQLRASIKAVFSSWLTPRAIHYRRIYNISDDMGTAVNVQMMVFGNLGDTSGTGVLFSRDPSTGENVLFGEFLVNAQGEDVVAGIRTPRPISEMTEVMPEVHSKILETTSQLETHFKDMQDIEFTVEEGTLFILQTRNGKRSAAAGVKIAVDMESEGLLTQKEALLQIDAEALDQLLHPRLKSNQTLETLTKGLPASPGAAVGQAVFNSEEAVAAQEGGKKVILIRHETSPEDVAGMYAAAGILTACGGMTSHAAVVARGMGKPCVSGATELIVNQNQAHVGSTTIAAGDWVTIDGSEGRVIIGKSETEPADITEDFKKILEWSDSFGNLHVRTNADTPADAMKAREFGAKGIGLCRTEHMFFEEDRIDIMREMILSKTEEERAPVLEKLLPFQRSDFEGIFKAMNGYPVNIRLLDPPLHEFLPHKDEDIKTLSQKMNVSFETLKEQVLSLHEVNPMLGHRGCRLMISYPSVARMQVRSIMEAACNMVSEGIEVKPEIMVPLVGVVSELKYLRQIMEEEIQQVFEEKNQIVEYSIGTMIEVPRACLVADDIAEVADYFSFGTNDLTQLTYGYSRDDVGKFLPQYIEQKFIPNDPFQSLDQEGVGRLMTMGVAKGRKIKPNLKVGICGEHGGDPDSIDFCFHQDLNYVSCSPYRVPIARVAKAQSAVRKWNS